MVRPVARDELGSGFSVEEAQLSLKPLLAHLARVGTRRHHEEGRLVLGAPDQQGDRGRAAANRIDGLHRQVGCEGRGSEAAATPPRPPPVLHLHRGGRGDQLLEGQRLQLPEPGPVEPDLAEHAVGPLRRLARGGHDVGRAALEDRAVVETCGRRHAEQGGDLPAAAGLPLDRHSVRVAPEGLDVVANPLEGEDQVELGGVARVREVGIELAEMEVSERAESMVERHRDDVLAQRDVASVRALPGAPADGEAAAVDPHHDRAPGAVQPGCEHVEAQAILALYGGSLGSHAEEAREVPPHALRRVGEGPALGRDGAPVETVPHAGPGLRGARRHEATASAGGRSVGNALEGQGAVRLQDPAHPPVGRLHDG